MKSVDPIPEALPRRTLWTLAAVLMGFVLLALLHGLGVAWSPGVVAATAVVVVVTTLVTARRHPANPQPDPTADRIWDRLESLGAGGVLAIFAVATQLGWNVMSDYVFHWGMKGRRFAAAKGLDFEFLSLPWQAHLHPDYPNLLPTLYSAGFTLTGRTDWAVVAPWSILFFALFLAAGRALARHAVTDPATRVLGLGALWAACLAFAVQPMVAGGGDLPLAVAVLLACHALLLPTTSPSRDLQVGCIAAFAAACKLEGMPLAASLVGLYGLKILSTTDGEPGARIRHTCLSVLRAAVFPAVVIGLWLAPVLTHGLFLDSNTAGLDLGHLPTVIRELTLQLVHPVWHGMPLVLLGLPVLCLKKGPWRFPALLPAIQATFYVYVYLAGPVDTELWIQTSASRLFLHLVPAVTLLLVAAVSGRPVPEARFSTSSTTGA